MEGAEWPPVNFKFQFRLWCVRAAGLGAVCGRELYGGISRCHHHYTDIGGWLG